MSQDLIKLKEEMVKIKKFTAFWDFYKKMVWWFMWLQYSVIPASIQPLQTLLLASQNCDTVIIKLWHCHHKIVKYSTNAYSINILFIFLIISDYCLYECAEYVLSKIREPNEKQSRFAFIMILDQTEHSQFDLCIVLCQNKPQFL